jgi:hypothetical protein
VSARGCSSKSYIATTGKNRTEFLLQRAEFGKKLGAAEWGDWRSQFFSTAKVAGNSAGDAQRQRKEEESSHRWNTDFHG